ncbi:MAG TPA: hypothetical protein VGD30_10065 [Telluria sp.]
MKTKLSLDQIHALVYEKFPALKRETNSVSTSYFLESESKPNRIVRLKPAPYNLLDLKLAQTSASEGARSLERVDSTGALAALIESEIAFVRGRAAMPRSQALLTPRESRVHISTQRAIAHVAPFVYELDLNGVLDTYLLYLWEIRNAAGVLLGKYLGKATGHYRPLKRYGKRVQKVMLGAGGRRVHYSLVDAALVGHQVKVTLLCNAPTKDALRAWEYHSIAALDCFGDRPEQLNATRGRLLSPDQVPGKLAYVVRAMQDKLC